MCPEGSAHKLQAGGVCELTVVCVCVGRGRVDTQRTGEKGNRPAREAGGPRSGRSPLSFPAGGWTGLLCGAGVEPRAGPQASVVAGGASPSTEVPGVRRPRPTAGAKVAKASRRPHMVGSKGADARDSRWWVGSSLPAGCSGAPRPFLQPPHAPCGSARPQPSGWPRTLEGRGEEGRGGSRLSARGGPRERPPRVSAPTDPAPPPPASRAHPPHSGAAVCSSHSPSAPLLDFTKPCEAPGPQWAPTLHRVPRQVLCTWPLNQTSFYKQVN